MSKSYEVVVNNETYYVTLKEITESDAKEKQASISSTSTSPSAQLSSAPKPSNSATQAVKAPMAGTLLKYHVTVGQQVKKGDILCMLEAMKMENEILAPIDGTVDSLAVSPGTNVESNEALLYLG